MSGHSCLHNHNQCQLMMYEDLEGLFHFIGGDSNHCFKQLCSNGQGFTQKQRVRGKNVIKYIKQTLRILCQTFFNWWKIDQGSKHTAYVWGKPHSVALRLELTFHARLIRTRRRRKAQCLQIHVKTRKGKNTVSGGVGFITDCWLSAMHCYSTAHCIWLLMTHISCREWVSYLRLPFCQHKWPNTSKREWRVLGKSFIYTPSSDRTTEACQANRNADQDWKRAKRNSGCQKNKNRKENVTHWHQCMSSGSSCSVEWVLCKPESRGCITVMSSVLHWPAGPMTYFPPPPI